MGRCLRIYTIMWQRLAIHLIVESPLISKAALNSMNRHQTDSPVVLLLRLGLRDLNRDEGPSQSPLWTVSLPSIFTRFMAIQKGDSLDTKGASRYEGRESH